MLLLALNVEVEVDASTDGRAINTVLDGVGHLEAAVRSATLAWLRDRGLEAEARVSQ